MFTNSNTIPFLYALAMGGGGSGGGSDSPVMLVTYDDSTGAIDKSYNDLKAAAEAGKICYLIYPYDETQDVICYLNYYIYDAQAEPGTEYAAEFASVGATSTLFFFAGSATNPLARW